MFRCLGKSLDVVRVPGLLLIAGGFAVVGCSDDAGSGADECRYENGRTYMEEVNHCNTMRDQGVQCIVPPPPVC